MQSYLQPSLLPINRGRCSRDRMVVGLTTTYAIGAYRISISVRCTAFCDKVCQFLATGWWFSAGSPVSCSNITDRHDKTEIVMKVALNTIHQIWKPNLPTNHKINIPTIHNTLIQTFVLTNRQLIINTLIYLILLPNCAIHCKIMYDIKTCRSITKAKFIDMKTYCQAGNLSWYLW
jgi:hypothetical protein